MRANDAWSQGAFTYPVPAWHDPEGIQAGSLFRGQLPVVPGDIEPIYLAAVQLRDVRSDVSEDDGCKSCSRSGLFGGGEQSLDVTPELDAIPLYELEEDGRLARALVLVLLPEHVNLHIGLSGHFCD